MRWEGMVGREGLRNEEEKGCERGVRKEIRGGNGKGGWRKGNLRGQRKEGKEWAKGRGISRCHTFKSFANLRALRVWFADGFI